MDKKIDTNESMDAFIKRWEHRIQETDFVQEFYSEREAYSHESLE